MDKKVETERPVRRLTQRRDVLPHHRQRPPRATDRAQAAGVGDRRRERRRGKTAHRRLDYGMGDVEQIEEISAWPHEVTLCSLLLARLRDGAYRSKFHDLRDRFVGKRIDCTTPPIPSIRVLRSELGQVAECNELIRSDEICSRAAVSEEVRSIFDNARQNNLPNDA